MFLIPDSFIRGRLHKTENWKVGLCRKHFLGLVDAGAAQF